ncbi:MAG: hypothetical protein A3F10_04620 [Coxiella sp. RIFCSPHIGHO2_12_FULL_42_15]|nr:MAG: hypothetical protein A3F10_04620 [Coxiella sp. RIFCSPHIGHO2_12_FULL_42_15]
MNNKFRFLITATAFAVMTINIAFASVSCNQIGSMSAGAFLNAVQTSPEYYNTILSDCITNTATACNNSASCVQSLWKYRDQANYYVSLKQIAATRMTTSAPAASAPFQSAAPSPVIQQPAPQQPVTPQPQQPTHSDDTDNNNNSAVMPYEGNTNNNDIYKDIRF